MKRFVFFAAMLLCFFSVRAQSASDIEMADLMRSSGKIYVVIATIVIVFIGLAVYLFGIDRRLRKIEKDN